MKKVFFLLMLGLLLLSCRAEKEVIPSENMSQYQLISACYFGCYVVVKQDGTLWSFGNQQIDESGYGEIIVDNENLIEEDTFVKEETPSFGQKVGTATDWSGVQVAIGRKYVYAIKENGTLWRWEREVNESHRPIKVHQVTNSHDWKDVKVYFSHESSDCFDGTFGIKKDGTLWSWDYGYDGYGNPINDTVPKKIRANHEWNKLYVSCSDRFVVKEDGSLYRDMGDNLFKKVDEKSEDKDRLSFLLNNLSMMPSKSIKIEDNQEMMCE